MYVTFGTTDLWINLAHKTVIWSSGSSTLMQSVYISSGVGGRYKQVIIDFYLSMFSSTDDLTAHLHQVQEEKWWHLPTVPYLKYGDIPQLSRWTTRVIPETSDMTLAVDGNNLNFPRPWISICFLLDLQQLSSLASAILHATSNPVFSTRLYSN